MAAVAVALVFTSAAPASAQIIAFNAKPVSGVEGKSLGSPRVVTFQDTGTCNNGAYQINVNWGPAEAPSIATVAKAVNDPPGNCTYDAAADHVYRTAGRYDYTVTICNGATCAQPVTATATIGDAPVAGKADDVRASATQEFAGQVGEINDDNKLSVQGDFTASIDWGDGTAATPGQITGSAGSFQVGGSHTYASPGTFRVVVTVQHNGRSIILDPAGATVTPAPSPTDTDGDGIPDVSDQCATTPGVLANSGCPAVPPVPSRAVRACAATIRLSTIRTRGLCVSLRGDAGVRAATIELRRGRRTVARRTISVTLRKDRASRVHVRFSARSIRRLKAGRYGIRVRIRGIDRVLGANVTFIPR